MSGFSPTWLQLREPFDHTARSEPLARLLDRSLPRGPRRILDLGCGHGSNFRWLAPRLGGAQDWVLLDHDPRLLAAIPDQMARWADARDKTVHATATGLQLDRWTITPRSHDLLDRLPACDAVDAVVTSALLDLVSWHWLEGFVDWLVAARLPLLAALTVDGRIEWSPGDRADARVHDGFRHHQLTDRGFGSSPGSGATRAIAARLRYRRYRLHSTAADWVIPAHHRKMLAEMIDGIAGASREMSHDPAEIDAWKQRRFEQLDQGRLSLRIGHQDLLALPPE